MSIPSKMFKGSVPEPAEARVVYYLKKISLFKVCNTVLWDIVYAFPDVCDHPVIVYVNTDRYIIYTCF